MKRHITLIILLLSVSLGGCATQNRPQYIWKDYSASLYTVKKNPSDESLKTHKDLLLSIIEESKSTNYRVPPGVYCEYGYILMKEGKKEEALVYFDLEEKTYPESRVFIQNLKKYQKKGASKENDGGVTDTKGSKDKPSDTDSRKEGDT